MAGASDRAELMLATVVVVVPAADAVGPERATEAAADRGGSFDPARDARSWPLLVWFASASSAVEAAVDILAAMPDDVAAGMAAGELSLLAASPAGQALDDAGRLAAAAAPGQILAGAEVALLAGSRASVAFRPRDDLAVPGLTDVVEVGWEAAATVPTPPIPAALARERRGAFAARAEPLGRVRSLWASAREGEPATVLIGGEPGVGKTRLAAELADEIHRAGAGVVLFGRCGEDMAVPYRPFVEALRSWSASVQQQGVVFLGEDAEELARLVPELVDEARAVDEPLPADRYRLLESYASWMTRLGTQSPVLLVIDDLHWVDAPTIELLLHLRRQLRAAGGPVMVLGTYRDTEVGRDHGLFGLLESVREDDPGAVVSLRGLSEEEAVELCAAELASLPGGDRHDPASLVRALLDPTAGNALFLCDAIRHLVSSASAGELLELDGADAPVQTSLVSAMPRGVASLTAERVRKLTDDCQLFLRHASVVGNEFDPRVPRWTAELPEDGVAALVAEAETAGLVLRLESGVDGDRIEPSSPADVSARCAFAHGVVRRALYDQLPAIRRAHLHARTAAALEMFAAPDDGAAATEIAHHWGEAAHLGYAVEAASAARRAGHAAADQLAYASAADWFSRAGDYLAEAGDEHDGTRAELGVHIARARLDAGQDWREDLLAAVRLAQEVAAPDAVVAAGLVVASRSIVAGRQVDQALVDLVTQALAVVEAGSADHARLLVAVARETRSIGDRDELIGMVQTALGVARELDDRVLLADVVLQAAWSFRRPDLFTERGLFLDQLAAVPPDRLSLPQRSDLHAEAAAYALERGDRSAFEAESMGVLAAEARLRRGVSRLREAETAHTRSFLDGDADLAGRRVRERDRLEIALAGSTTVGRLPTALFLRGDWAGAGREVLRVAAETGVAVGALDVWARWYGGDPRGARRRLVDETDRGFPGLRLDDSWPASGALALWVAALARQPLVTRLLFEALRPYATRIVMLPGGLPFVPLDAVLGLAAAAIGRHDEAEDLFSIGSELAEGLRSPTLALITASLRERSIVSAGDGAPPGAAERVRSEIDRLQRLSGLAFGPDTVASGG